MGLSDCLGRQAVNHQEVFIQLRLWLKPCVTLVEQPRPSGRGCSGNLINNLSVNLLVIQLNMPVLVFSRCEAHYFFKLTVKMRKVIEADFKAHL